MTIPHAKSAANTTILHSHKDSQTNTNWKTDHIGLQRPKGKNLIFVDSLLQPIAKLQKSYLKDTTDFINFIEKTRVVENAILVSMDVTSLYTNIPQEEGITIICKAYETFYQNKPPIPSQYLADLLGKNYLQVQGTAMGTKIAVAFANIFLSAKEKEIINKNAHKPLVWNTYSHCGM